MAILLQRKLFGVREIPVEPYCQHTNDNNKGEARYHADTRTGSVPKQSAEHSARKGCAGVNVLYEYVGSVACEKVADNTAAYAGEDGDEYSEKNIAAEACVYGNSRAAYGENAKTGSIADEHEKLIYTIVGENAVAHGGNEDYDGNRNSQQGVGGIPKSCGGRNAEDKVTDYSAAYGCGKTEDTYAENVHILFQTRNSTGNGKGNGADYFKNQDEKSHAAASNKKSTLCRFGKMYSANIFTEGGPKSVLLPESIAPSVTDVQFSPDSFIPL